MLYGRVTEHRIQKFVFLGAKPHKQKMTLPRKTLGLGSAERRTSEKCTILCGELFKLITPLLSPITVLVLKLSPSKCDRSTHAHPSKTLKTSLWRSNSTEWQCGASAWKVQTSCNPSACQGNWSSKDHV